MSALLRALGLRNNVNGFSQLGRGLYLPSRRLLVEWGAEFASLEDSADEASHWMPHGQSEPYGQIRWNECLVPFQTEAMHKSELKGSVIAFVRGKSLTVRSFAIEAWDNAWLRERVFQYGTWMQQLSKLLGPPEVPTKDFEKGIHIVPPCVWRQNFVVVTLTYSDFKGDPVLRLEIAHDKYAL